MPASRKLLTALGIGLLVCAAALASVSAPEPQPTATLIKPAPEPASATASLPELGPGAQLIQPDTGVRVSFRAATLTSGSHQDAWQVLVAGFALQSQYSHAAVRERARFYARHARSTRQILQRALLYLPFISQQLGEHDFPAELALMPAVESHFKPYARAASQAAGLWQFMPRSARLWGLPQNKWYDARLDPHAATHAAVKYLQFLHDRYGNWLLAIAAYNAGEGTVDDALDGERHGSFWDLDLPDQTENYIPSILGYAELIAHPRRYGFRLPHASAATALVQVRFSAPVALADVAQAAGISLQRLQNDNPGRLTPVLTPATPMHLYLPLAAARRLQQRPPPVATAFNNLFQQSYRVQPGDTLSGIAQAHHVKTASIMTWNHITNPRHLHSGQRLTLWLQRASANGSGGGFYPIRLHLDKDGNLAAVAKRFHLKLARLYAWNDMTPQDDMPGDGQLTILLSARHS